VLGGLARRAAFVAEVRKSKTPVIVVDSGDLFFSAMGKTDPEQAGAKARLLGRAYREMGVAAVNVGARDLLHGLDFLMEQAQAGLPLISANLLDPLTRAPVFSPYTVVTFSGIRIAWVGLTGESEDSAGIRERGDRFVVSDPVEAARETLLKLKDRADLIILLSDLALYRIQEVLKAGPGIDFVLGTEERYLSTKPLKKESAYFLQSTPKGLYVGRLDLRVWKPGHPFEDDGKALELQEELRRLDHHMKELERELGGPSKEETVFKIGLVKKRMAAVEEEILQGSAAGAKANRFIWNPVSINPAGPEDLKVREWIKEAQIDEDYMLMLFPERCEQE
jgi:2',3'-cyclic-nucleotide 2'-phosphodiesterase (5'-nucleotidase family)